MVERKEGRKEEERGGESLWEWDRTGGIVRKEWYMKLRGGSERRRRRKLMDVVAADFSFLDVAVFHSSFFSLADFLCRQN